jgi:hypothetical protein
MKIYPHYLTTFFSDKTNNYCERNSNKTVVIVDGSFNQDAFNVTACNPADIISKDKIYISKYSSFSPLLLSRIEGIDVSRVISMEKATKIIIDENLYKEYRSDLYYGEFTSTNEAYPTIRGLFVNKTDYDVSSLTRLMHPVTRERITDTSSYVKAGTCEPCVIINTEFDKVDLILNQSKKLVVTEKLEDYINNFLPELDKDALDSCLNMLGSKDMNAVKLGINMLATFNIKNYTIPISLAIRYNFQTLESIKALAAFKRVCNLCGLNINSIKGTPILEFNLQIYRNSNNPEHKILVRDSISRVVADEISNCYLRYLTEVGLVVDIHNT